MHHYQAASTAAVLPSAERRGHRIITQWAGYRVLLTDEEMQLVFIYPNWSTSDTSDTSDNNGNEHDGRTENTQLAYPRHW